jgi:hypothetical protein
MAAEEAGAQLGRRYRAAHSAPLPFGAGIDGDKKAEP